MTLPVGRTNRADEDLDEIWLHIAAESIPAAERLIERIEAAEDRLGEFPQLGQARPDLGADLRYWPVGNYLIIYKIDPDQITIVRVVHGARDIPALFSDSADD